MQIEPKTLIALLAPPTVGRWISDITSMVVCNGVRGRSSSLLTYAHGPEASRGSSVATKLDRHRERVAADSRAVSPRFGQLHHPRRAGELGFALFL